MHLFYFCQSFLSPKYFGETHAAATFAPTNLMSVEVSMGSVVHIDSQEKVEWEGAIQKTIKIDVTDVGNLLLIAQVEWRLSSFSARAFQQGFVTELDLDDVDPEDFMPIREMTQDKILSFCLAKEGGDQFIKNLLGVHSEQLAQRYKERNFRRFNINELPKS